MTTHIEKILADLKPEESSTFCSKIVTPFEALQIAVKDVGDFRLPLKPRAIKSLIKQSRPAKYGLKEQTLLDKTVRDVWEIPKSRVKINQRHWKKSFDTALLQLKTSPGISEQSKLKAELHNLIIYEPGQFFKPHQDSEKCDGMVATLVVLLPSYYRGGTLIVDHQGDKKRFTSRSTPEDKLTFIAFYADCHHEVTPVTDGYRVALTYNLSLKAGDDANVTFSNSATQEKLNNALADYFKNDPANVPEYLLKQTRCKKFAYLLDHEYTPKGLHWSRLKNGDRTRVNALKAVADNLDMDIYLGLIDIHESWECHDDADWGYHRRHRYWEYDEEIETKEKAQDEFTVGELIFSEIEFRHCMNPKGKAINMSDLMVHEYEVFSTKSMDTFKPFESAYEGYMGNYGNTMDRWYHRAAIILWHRVDHYLMLLECNPKEFLRAIMPLAKKKKERENVQRIVAHILPSWHGLRHENNAQNITRVLQLALITDNPENAAQLIKPLDETALCKETINELLELANAYGIDWCTDIFSEWLSNTYNQQIIIAPLLPVTKALLSVSSKNSLSLNNWLLKNQLKALQSNFDSDVKNQQQAQLDACVPQRNDALIALMSASLIAKDCSIYDELISYTINNKNLFPAIELVSVLLKTQRYSKQQASSKDAFNKLKRHVHKDIHAALNNKPRNENDWSINDKNRCDCADCKTLGKFLQAPEKQKIVWPLAKGRRQHMHQIIDSMKLPVTHTTERTGSPHKLHLTKTAQIFKREKALRNRYKKAADSLATMSKRSSN